MDTTGWQWHVDFTCPFSYSSKEYYISILPATYTRGFPAFPLSMQEQVGSVETQASDTGNLPSVSDRIVSKNL